MSCRCFIEVLDYRVIFAVRVILVGSLLISACASPTLSASAEDADALTAAVADNMVVSVGAASTTRTQAPKRTRV